MKYLLLLVAVAGCSSAQLFNKPGRPFSGFRQPKAVPAPARLAPRAAASDQAANVIRQESDINPDGSFTHFLELDNGISAQAQGVPRDLGGNPPVIPVVFKGAFSWTSPEGVPIVITYEADENGYRAQGDALPTPPAPHPQIARALEYIAKTQRL